MNLLQEYLQRQTPHAEEIAVWGGGSMPLRVVSYFCEELPPIAYVNSVRGIVLRGQDVLVMRNYDGIHHLLPGGRREQGESLAETLQREVLEEAGWLTGNYQLLGVVYFHHLAPKPADYRYLYPDFLNLIYLATALEHRPTSKLPGDYELEARFVAIDQVINSTLVDKEEVKWLEQALTKMVVATEQPNWRGTNTE